MKENLKKQAKEIVRIIKEQERRYKNGEMSQEEIRAKESWDGYMTKVHKLKLKK